ncbi:MAG: AbrB/MazE/SpoVT family DNA-binding domain-containing protein [Candidatus Nezhaarchaeales archaeon]
MIVSKVSRKGLTSIPAMVKRALDVEDGDTLIWEVDEKQKIAIVRVAKNPIKHLKGKYRDPNLTYENIEEKADELLVRELHANN